MWNIAVNSNKVVTSISIGLLLLHIFRVCNKQYSLLFYFEMHNSKRLTKLFFIEEKTKFYTSYSVTNLTQIRVNNLLIRLIQFISETKGLCVRYTAELQLKFEKYADKTPNFVFKSDKLRSINYLTYRKKMFHSQKSATQTI